MDEMTNNQATEQPKNSKIALIAIIIVVILALATSGFAFYWFSRPIYKVTKAIESADYQTAVFYYDRLKSEDRVNITTAFIDYCQKAKEEYIAEAADYDNVMNKLNVFEGALSEDSNYQDIIKTVSELKASRDAWNEAENFFNSKDYDNASEKYTLVISTDANYEKAQELIAECYKKAIVGTWMAELNLSKAITEQVGQEGLNIDFVLRLLYTFNEDGTATISTDDDSINQQLTIMFDNIINVVILQYCDQYNISAAEMDDLFIESYGVTFAEYVKSNMDMDSLVSDSIYQKKDCTYTVNGKEIVLIDVDGTTTSDSLEYKGKGTITLNASEGFETFEEYGITLPLTLNKQ